MFVNWIIKKLFKRKIIKGNIEDNIQLGDYMNTAFLAYTFDTNNVLNLELKKIFDRYYICPDPDDKNKLLFHGVALLDINNPNGFIKIKNEFDSRLKQKNIEYHPTSIVHNNRGFEFTDFKKYLLKYYIDLQVEEDSRINQNLKNLYLKDKNNFDITKEILFLKKNKIVYDLCGKFIEFESYKNKLLGVDFYIDKIKKQVIIEFNEPGNYSNIRQKIEDLFFKQNLIDYYKINSVEISGVLYDFTNFR